jgi:Fungal specific transcription factor domain/Fungal Zn(2)-Cys(6) binuclear cluster domain
MGKSRACDPCAARKAKCDRQSPYRRCTSLSRPCVTIRKQSKSGPKGPWARKKRETHAAESRRRGLSAETGSPRALPSPRQASSTQPPRSFTSSNLPVSLFQRYLDIYQQSLYPVWPVVSKVDLLLRLQDRNDIEAYALATAISAVTIAQLNLRPEGSSQLSAVDSFNMVRESERARHLMDYQESPSISLLLSSFFLHVASANQGQIYKAALLLREAITFAQLLGLNKTAHYHGLCKREAQLRLRIVWLLFITERCAASATVSGSGPFRY